MQPDKAYNSDMNSILMTIAQDYAMSYVGNFDMMIETKRQVKAGHSLSTSKARAVINTLLHDISSPYYRTALAALNMERDTPVSPSAASLRSPGSQAPATPVRPSGGNTGRLTVVRKPPFIRTRGRNKAPFGVTKHLAKTPRVHLLTPNLDVVWKLQKLGTRIGTYRYDEKSPRVLELRHEQFCNLHHSGIHPLLEWPTYDQFGIEIDEPMQLCRTCERLYYGVTSQTWQGDTLGITLDEVRGDL